MNFLNTSRKNHNLHEKKFSIVQEISSIIVLTDNINAIANLMVDMAINYTDAQRGSLMLADSRGELSILAARGFEIQLATGYRIKVGEGVAGTVAKNLVPVLVQDIDNDERFNSCQRINYRTKSFISCPIISKSKLLGILNINDKRDNSSFTEDELSLATTIANQAAIALENALLLNQLKLKAAELELMNSKLIEADVVQTEFLARISHDLRTPLNSIKGSIYYLDKSPNLSKDEQKEFFDIIEKETGKLITTVESQLDFLRLANETRSLHRSVIDLHNILHDVATSKSLTTALTEKNIDLTIDCSHELIDIVGDKIKVAQLFLNLIEGMSNFLQQGDCIQISATDHDFVKIIITLPRNIPENIIAQLFNSTQFFDRKTPDELLKLHLARKIIEIHDWNLAAENVGKTFALSINIPKRKRQIKDTALNESIDLFLEFIAELLEVQTCSIMLYDKIAGGLIIKSARGLPEQVISAAFIRPGDKISGWVALEGKPLLIEDIECDPRFAKRSAAQYTTKSLLSLPIIINDEVIGVLNLNNKKSLKPFSSKDLMLATVLSERIAYLIEKTDKADYHGEALKHFTSSLELLLAAEKIYFKKSGMLSDLILEIMDNLGTTEADKQLALYVSTIYDLGLMLIDERVLGKEYLLPSEANSMKIHPFTTIGLLSGFEFSETVKKAIVHHHEKYDGTGYPDRLKGTDIPLMARVLTVADAFCSMQAARPYRKAFSREKAFLEINKGSGTCYDPQIVQALNEVAQAA